MNLQNLQLLLEIPQNYLPLEKSCLDNSWLDDLVSIE